MVGLTAIFAASLTIFHQLQYRDALLTSARSKMGTVSLFHADRVRAIFRDVEIDAENSARFPPVEGIIRASQSPDGLDPFDGSSLAQWEARLVANFANLMRDRPHYTEFRFLKRDTDWVEFAHVVQTEQGPEGLLQPSRYDHAQGLLLSAPDLDEMPQLHYSEIEYGSGLGPSEGRPSIRVIRVVRDPQGEVFGAIVINIDFEMLLLRIHPRETPGLTVTAMTKVGDYLTFRPGEAPGRLIPHTDPDWSPTTEFEMLQAPSGAAAFTLSEDAAFFRVRVLSPSNVTPFELSIVTRMPRSVLFASAYRRLSADAWMTAGLIAFAIALAFKIGRDLSSPLTRLQNAVSERTSHTEQIVFEDETSEEVAQLAESIMAMTDDLILQTTRNEAILTNAADGIIVIDNSGVIEEVNPAAGAIFGYDPGELVGSRLTTLMPGEHAAVHQHYVDHAVPTPGPRNMAADRFVYGLRKDGSEFPLEVSISSAYYSDKTHFIGVLRDITFKRAMETQRDALIAALEESNAELDQFAYVASHDLKAPLRVIDNASRWLEEDLQDHLDDDTKESMHLLRNRVQRMERLLDDLLEHSRIGRVDLPQTLVNGREMFDDIAGLVEMPEGFELDVAPQFAEITVPRMPLQTVLLNLVSNAFRHHDKTTGRVLARVEVEPDIYIFSITDDGPGIPRKYHEKVFELFQTLRPRDQLECSGMGLAMVKKHLQIIGGSIEVHSPDERGTTFIIKWPRSQNQAGVIAA